MQLLANVKRHVFTGATFLVMFSFSQMSSAFNYTIELTQRQLQEKIEAMMPLEKKQYMITVRLSQPKINLIESNNAIGFFTHMEVIAPGGLKGSGRGEIQGSVRFEKESGEFYLDNAKLSGMQIDRIPKQFLPSISKICEALMARALAQFPVYRLKDDDARHQLAKSTLKEIKVHDQKLLIMLGMF